MKGKRMQFAVQSGLSPDAYPFNGLQDDGKIIECAQAGSNSIAKARAASDARTSFMEAHRNPDVVEFLKKIAGGTLYKKVVTGDASGIKIDQVPRSTQMEDKSFLSCALARDAREILGKREKKEQKSGNRRPKGKR
jgi:hypothetical protein